MKKQILILLFLLSSSVAWSQTNSSSTDPNDRIGRESGPSVSAMNLLWSDFQPYVVLSDQSSQVTLGGDSETPFKAEGQNGISTEDQGRSSRRGNKSSN